MSILGKQNLKITKKKNYAKRQVSSSYSHGYFGKAEFENNKKKRLSITEIEIGILGISIIQFLCYRYSRSWSIYIYIYIYI